jgi:hypothetical protein
VAGAAGVQPAKHAGDVAFVCPACGHTNVAAVAPGIGHVVGGEELPDMSIPVDDWRADRRKAVGVGTSRPMGEGDARWRAGE